MPRWERAVRAMPPPPARILDCGVGMGRATRLLSRRGYDVCGIDAVPQLVQRLRALVPTADLRVADAASLPWPDAEFAAAVCLEVLEHVPSAGAVVAELARVTKPGGVLVVSVPHAGLLAGADSLNVYQRLRPDDVPTEDPSWSQKPHHDHLTVAQITDLLAPHFSVEWISLTGTGIAELIHLPLLLVMRGISPRHRWLYFRLLIHVYVVIAIIDDLVPFGPLSYNLLVGARRRR